MSDMVLFERPTSCQPNLFARQKNTSAIPFRSLANPFAPCSLPSLPYDVLLTIAESLDADGIHGLGMTCKSLYEFTQTRSLWLRLATDMLDQCHPLPVNGFQRLWELSTLALSVMVRRGYKIRESWANGNPQLVSPYRTIQAPSEEIVWLSPITSKYTLCCTKIGKVLCWDVLKGECVAEWYSGEDWEIWKCRVEFDERVVYFAMAKRVTTGIGTDCQLMALTFPPEINGTLPSKPVFAQLSSFNFPGHVISVYLLDPLRRILSAYIWMQRYNTLGLYVLLDWNIPIYVFIDTGIPCEPPREWSCIGYESKNVVIHAEEKNHTYQFHYSLEFLRSLGTRKPPGEDAPRICPQKTFKHPFLNNHSIYDRFTSQSAHFVRQWWPTLPHAGRIRQRSCTIILLTFRVPHPSEPEAENCQPLLEKYPPGTYLFTIAQHYFSVPLCNEQLRWWYVRDPFEIVCLPYPMGDFIDAPEGIPDDGSEPDENIEEHTQQISHDAGGPELHGPIAEPAHAIADPLIPVPGGAQEAVEEIENLNAMPLIAVDFGCAVWLEYVRVGSDEKRLRFVTFPSVDVDRSVEGFDCMSKDTEVRTLDIPPEVDLRNVCHIGIDQAQGAIILGLSSSKVFIMRYD